MASLESDAFDRKPAIIVGNIPREMTSEKITIHFQKRRCGGDDVSHVLFPFQRPDSALVIFDSAAVIKTVTQYDHKLGNQTLTVQPVTFTIDEIDSFSDHGEKIFSKVKATVTRTLSENQDLMNAIYPEVSDDVKVCLENQDILLIGTWEEISKAYKKIQTICKKMEFGHNIDTWVSDHDKTSKAPNENVHSDQTSPLGVDVKISDFRDAFEINMALFDRMKLLFAKTIKNLEDVHGRFMQIHSASSSEAAKLQIKTSENYDISVLKDEIEQMYEKTAFDSSVEHIQLQSSSQNAQLSEQLTKVSGRGANATLEDGGCIVIKGLKDAVVIAKKNLKEFLKIGVLENDSCSKHPDDREELSAIQPAPSTLASYSSNNTTEMSMQGITILIYQADITKVQVDAIVNAANIYLQHAGGVAAAIARAAGVRFQAECESYIHKYGDLQVGDVVPTRAGNLPCQLVFHAVGPDARLCSDMNTFSQVLGDTFYMCFQKAMEERMASLAVPLISSGIFGGNKELCARMLYKAVDIFARNNDINHCSLKQIHLVNIDVETTETICQCFVKFDQKRNMVENSTGKPLHCENKSDTQGKHANRARDDRAYGDILDDQGINPGPTTQMMKNLEASEERKTNDVKKRSTTSKNNSASLSRPPVKPTSSVSPPEPHVTPQIQHGMTTRQFHKSQVNGKSKLTAKTDHLVATTNAEMMLTSTTNTQHQMKQRNSSQSESTPDATVPNSSRGKTRKSSESAGQGSRKQTDTVRQPPGIMLPGKSMVSLPGNRQYDTIVITYHFERGVQIEGDPKPGMAYEGTKVTAYLPNSPEGQRVCRLLQNAFKAELTFKIGQTSDCTYGIVPCDIPHKDNRYGYPDIDYLPTVIQFLAEKGIRDESSSTDV